MFSLCLSGITHLSTCTCLVWLVYKNVYINRIIYIYNIYVFYIVLYIIHSIRAGPTSQVMLFQMLSKQSIHSYFPSTAHSLVSKLQNLLHLRSSTFCWLWSLAYPQILTLYYGWKIFLFLLFFFGILFPLFC